MNRLDNYRRAVARFRNYLYKCEGVDKEKLDRLMTVWWPSTHQLTLAQEYYASSMMSELRSAFPNEYRAWLTLNRLKGGGMK